MSKLITRDMNRINSRKALFLLMLFFGWTISAQAVLTNYTAVIDDDVNGDGVAGIGDKVRVFANSDNATNGTTPFIDSGNWSVDPTNLPLVIGTLYRRIFTVRSGGYRNTAYMSEFIDNDDLKQTAAQIHINTRQPSFNSAVAQINSGNAIGKPGDVVRIQAEVDNYTNATRVYTSHAQITGGSNINLTRISTSGTTAVYRYEVPLTAAMNLEDDNVQFTITVEIPTDPVTTVTQTTNFIRVDTNTPGFSTCVIQVRRGGVDTGGTTARLNDALRISGDLTVANSAGRPLYVRVDLSSIGGSTNQPVSLAPAGTDYQYEYTIIAGSSDNATSRQFTVRAYDEANNTVYEQTTPVVYVDSIAPTISGAAAVKVGGTGTGLKLGDTIQFSATISNIDNGVVWVDLRQIGGQASHPLSLYSGSTYRATLAVQQTTTGAALDEIKNFPIYVVDDVGNYNSAITGDLSIDNEAPIIASASHRIFFTPSASHPRVRVGDKLEFQVGLASSSGAVYDAQTVTINVSSLGGSSNQSMTFDGVGSYTYTINSLAAGTLDEGVHAFSIAATDNAGNAVTGNIQVDLDNSPPIPSPMNVSISPDVTKLGAVNLNDTVTFTVACTDPDVATAEIDLSLMGGSANQLMTYNGSLGQFSFSSATAQASTENTSYYFRAKVTDKSGNSVFSFANAAYEVDCRPPVINSVSAAITEVGGSAVVANVGDKLIITANIDLTAIDGGTPYVNLTPIGGNSAQQLYDDGSHDDGPSGDGVYGYSTTLAAGALDGVAQEFTISLKDNASNNVNMTTADGRVFDTKPLQVNYFLVSTTDANSNSTVDLDGEFGATDTVTLKIRVTGAAADFSTDPNIDLLKLGYTAAETITTADVGTIRNFEKTYVLLKGDTNRENTTFFMNITDANGNITNGTSTPQILIDNKPPTIVSGPSLTFVTDTGVLGEANLNDVIRVQIEVSGNDSVAPVLDLRELATRNGISISPDQINMSGGPSVYTYNWTIPPGLGTPASLPVNVFDTSRNMVIGRTATTMFLSKIPLVRGYAETRCTLNDLNPATNIANVNDQVSFRLVLQSAYAPQNAPPATVAVDIRSISADGSEGDAILADGDASTHWALMTMNGGSVGATSDWVYELNNQTVFAGGKDYPIASFPYKVLHPSNPGVVLASGAMNCNPSSPFGIDAEVPLIFARGMEIIEENGNNISSTVANIGDVIKVWAEIRNFEDPGSASVWLSHGTSGAGIQRLILTRNTITGLFEATFAVTASGTASWSAFISENSHKLRYTISVSDDADNLVTDGAPPLSTFIVDNTPVIPLSFVNVIRSGSSATNADLPFVGTANIATGTASDSFIASVTADIKPLKGWIDLSAIQGSTTWPITFVGIGGNDKIGSSTPFLLATAGIDLATFTLPYYLMDQAGNISASETILAVDTTRPTLASATYDGEKLRLTFSEPLKLIDSPTPPAFDISSIRIGKQNILEPFDSTSMINLNVATDTLVTPTIDSNRIDITIGAEHRAQIADWGEVTLYITLGYHPTNGTLVVAGRDLGGNPVLAIPREPSSMTIGYEPFVMRPNLVDGKYDGVTPANKDKLFLTFDRAIATDTFTNTTLNLLTIVKDSGYDGYSTNYLKRYTMQGDVGGIATDVVGTAVSSTLLTVTLSQDAQDWIAMKFKNTGPQIALAIAAPVNVSDPPMLRDKQGNKVNPIAFTNPQPASLTPYNLPFDLQSPKITFNATHTSLALQGTTRMRLYLGEDQFKPPRFWPKTTSNAVPSRIFLYKNENRTGPALSLSRSTLDPILNDYYSTIATLTLHPDEVKEILNWNTNQIYMAVEQGAFRDLWDNQNSQFTSSGNGVPLPLLTSPAGAEKIKLVAVSTSDKTPIKDYTTVGSLYYEVEFAPGSFTQGSTIFDVPISYNFTPTLALHRQVDATLIENASFSTWLERTVAGKKRYIARFNNTGAFLNKPLDRATGTWTVANINDIFGVAMAGAPTPNTHVYYMGEKTETGNGFGDLASQAMIFDTVIPGVVSVIPSGTIGIKPAGTATFTVTFNEPMDTTLAYAPTLTLRTVAAPNSQAMGFTFQQWVADGLGLASQAVYVNSSNFDNNSYQGDCKYYVSGGIDLAGNQGATDQMITSSTVTIKSKGPLVSSWKVETYQSTVATSAQLFVNRPFSPDVPTGIATITITYPTAISPTGVGVHEMHIYDGETTFRASAPVTIDVSGNWGIATFPTASITAIIGSGPATLNLRIYDTNLNEGSIRGSIVFDAVPPKLTSWTLSNAKLRSDGKVYFSPAVHGSMKIDIGDLNQTETLSLRVTNPANTTPALLSTDTYLLSQWTGYGHTIQFNGKSATKTGNPLLAQNSTDTFLLRVVDEAGNLGVSAVASDQSSASVVIDNTNPLIAGLTLHRNDTKAEATRLNPRITDLEIRVATSTADTETAPGKAFARIKSGSTVVRDDLALTATGTVLVATWDGKNASGTLVDDGTYQVEIVDMAENPAAITKSLNIVTSIFKVSSALEVDKNTIQVTFSHDVNSTHATDGTRYTITGSSGNIAVGTPLTMVGSKTVQIPLASSLTHGITYTVTAALAPSFDSFDGDPLSTGNNIVTMTPDPADAQGPKIVKIDYVGTSGARQFNIVFDEQVATSAANNLVNYSLTTSTDTIPLESVALLDTGTSVRISTQRDIAEGVNYTVNASGVEDLYKNKASSGVTFTGKDVTPPVMTVSVFSNPANEYDIAVVAKANEDLSGNPSSVVTQSGGNVTNLPLNAGPGTRLFMGGTLLDKNYTGQAVITVTATDITGNSGTSVPLTFTTAYINASIKVQVNSGDGKMAAIFKPGTLTKDSFVTVLPVHLEKVASGAAGAAGIKAKVFADLNTAELRGLKLGIGEGQAADELTPVDMAYTFNIPAGRIAQPIDFFWKVGDQPLATGVALFQTDENGAWKFVSRTVVKGWLHYSSARAGTFALMKDSVPPKANMQTKINLTKPFRDAKPSFDWELDDLGSGLEPESAHVILNGREYPAILDVNTKKAVFKVQDALPGGEHAISLKVADRTGNTRITQEILFLIQPPLVIHEMTHFPNPARARVTLRVGTNRPDISADMFKVSIYDSAGHKVRDSRGLDFVTRNSGNRKIQEMVWDLTNDKGNAVANGVYFAKVTLSDPDNLEKKAKVTHKIAVLR